MEEIFEERPDDGDNEVEDDDVGALKAHAAHLKKSADVKSKEEAVEESRRRAAAIANVIASKSQDDPDRVRYAMSSFIYKRIAASLTAWPRAWRIASVEEWCEDGFMSIFYEAISGCDHLADLTYANSLYKALMQITDCSYKACAFLCEKGIIPVVIRIISDKTLKENIEGKLQSRLLIRAVGSCHNLAKLTVYINVFEEHKAVEALTFYMADMGSTAKMQMSALCAVSFLLNDKDACSLSDQYNIIPKLVQCLSKALKMKGRKHSEGFSAEEIVASLSNLALNEDNKIKLADIGILPLLVKMLTLNPLEKGQAVQCLWRLAFNEEIRQKILAEPNFRENIEAICAESSNADEALKSKAQKAAEFIRLGKNGLGSSSSKDTEKQSLAHIFISYSWKQQEIVKRIKEALVQRGYKTWFDLDQMNGSTLQSMASAVENAFLVLICYSDNYRTSNNCRTECEYVFQLGKPFIPINMQYRYQPDGWLGIVIGARLYLDFSLAKRPFEDMLPKLLSTVAETGNPQKGTDEPVKSSPKTSYQILPSGEIHDASSSSCKCDILSAKLDQTHKLVEALATFLLSPQASSSTTLKVVSPAKADKIRLWSYSDIETWLTTEQLQDCLPHITSFDGKALVGLYGMKNSAPETYYRSVLQLCGDSFPLSIRFTAALENMLGES